MSKLYRMARSGGDVGTETILRDEQAERDVALGAAVRQLVAILPNGWRDLYDLIPDSDSFAAALTSTVYTVLKAAQEAADDVKG